MVSPDPEAQGSDFKWVRLGFDGSELAAMELQDKLGQTTTLEFSAVKRNPAARPFALHLHRRRAPT